MCGICGIIGSASDNVPAMRRMLDVLRHRGPDDEGIRQSPGAILGQRRLSIIDVAGGHQPIPNEDGTVWVVCNGEIYNYRNLRRELSESGHTFSTQSDSEVIVHLYEEHGVDCLKHLRGMFAFAVWDERREQLFIARDHLGQKPLYYSVQNGTLAFASEIKGLLAFDAGLRQLDLEALEQYLTLRVIAPPRSMFKRIRKLPPASYLLSKKGKQPEIRRYWDLDFEPKLQGQESDLIDELEALLIDTLKHHMVSDVPVGAFLSGGLDSTLIVAMLMSHATQDAIPTFSIGIPHAQYNEAPYARMVAERYGTSHEEQTLIPSLLDTLPDLVWHLDEPSDSLSVCTYLVSEMASRKVKVVLGGDGGDEAFGGYDRYFGNLFTDHYARIPHAVRKHFLAPVLTTLPHGRWYKSFGHRARWLHRLSYLKGSERYARSLSYFYFDGDSRSALLTRPVQESLRDFDPESSIREPYDAAHSHEALDRMIFADLCVRLPDHPVMITDRMTMAHGLEARSPFMDRDLVEFAARIPAKFKLRGRTLRYLQRQLAKRYLPAELLTRPKQGFASALPYLLKGEYRTLFSTFLTSARLVDEGIFEAGFVGKLLGQHLAGSADHGNRLWLLLNSEIWYRMHIDNDSCDDLYGMIGSPATSRGDRKTAVTQPG